MNKLITGFLLLLLASGAVVGLVVAYREMRKERDLEATAEAPVVAPSRVEQIQGSTPVVHLDPETQRRLGLKTALLVPGVVAHELIATARVLDGAALSAQLNEIRSAQATFDAARLDYARKQQLFESGQNASAAAVEAADALLKLHSIALDAAHDRIVAAWGTAIAVRGDLRSLSESLLRREAALVRVELLSAQVVAAQPQTVRLLRQSGEEITAAQVLGPATSTDSPISGQMFLALATTNAANLIPGSTLAARLDTNAPDHGAVLPRQAVVRHAGSGWVYTKTGDDRFSRRRVPLDEAHPDGWLVPGPWPEPVVVSGAQSLLSEELKGAIQLRD